MGIIIKNMNATTGLTHVRMKVTGKVPYDKKYDYLIPDTSEIAISSSTDNYEHETGIRFFGHIGANGYDILAPYSHEEYISGSGTFWRSGRSNSSTTRRELGLFFPEKIRPNAFFLIGGWGENADSLSFVDGLLQATETPYDEVPVWETIYDLGDLGFNEDTGVLQLNLNKDYYGFRIESRNVLAISNYYSRIGRFNLLKLR